MNKRIFITGVNGFIGKALANRLSHANYSVRGAVRKISLNPVIAAANFDVVAVGDINSKTNWQHVLKNIDVVIHTAARVHMMDDNATDPLAEYREINTKGTLKLLEDAAKAGVKKFIFISSIKVNGEETKDIPFTEHDSFVPTDPYGLSKWEAEQGIVKQANELGIKYTIIRLPLVYGSGVKANFANLLKLVKSKMPLPFAMIKNKRSLLYIGNLTAAVLEIIKNPNSDNQTYLLSDNDDVSTAQLVKVIAKAFNIKAILLPVSASLFRLAGRLTRQQKAISRLLGSLQIDSSKIRKDLNWIPPYTVESGLTEMVQHENEVRNTAD